MASNVCKLQAIIVCCFILQYVVTAQSSTQAAIEKDEEPPVWVDALFIIFTLLLHLTYGSKLIDYSLQHLECETPEKQTIIIKNEEDDIYDDELWEYEPVPHYTTKSNHDTKSRDMKASSFLCCIQCSPQIFTWERTLYFRQFLRCYMTISTLIAMVFYFEFFGNLLLEFIVTILIHCRQTKYWYYTMSLLLLPEIVYVFRINIWLSWDALVAAWSLSCDENGDIESRRKDIIDNTKQIVDQISHLNAAKTDNDDNDDNKDNIPHHPKDNDTTLIVQASQKIIEGLNASVHQLFGINNPKLRKKLPDYFIGTCFRLWFFVITIFAAMMGTVFVGTELEFTSTFYGFALRYMSIGGLLWCVVYTIFAWFFALISRVHNFLCTAGVRSDTESIWNVFFLIDVEDKQKEHKTWAFIKFLIICFCLFGSILFIFIGIIFNLGFVIFIGIVLHCYQWSNMFQVCKPNALIALLRGQIPPPSMRFHAHKIIQRQWEKIIMETEKNETLKAWTKTLSVELEKLHEVAKDDGSDDMMNTVCNNLSKLRNWKQFFQEHAFCKKSHIHSAHSDRSNQDNENEEEKDLEVMGFCELDDYIKTKDENVKISTDVIEHSLVYIHLMEGYKYDKYRYNPFKYNAKLTNVIATKSYDTFDVESHVRTLNDPMDDEVDDIGGDKEEEEKHEIARIELETVDNKTEIEREEIKENKEMMNDIKSLQEEAVPTSCCDYHYTNIKQTVAYLKNLCLNFSKYWFKVYKPFEEFDITDTEQGENILHGFQWIRWFTDKLDDKTLRKLTKRSSSDKKNKSRYCKKCLSGTCKKMLDCSCNLLILLLILCAIGSIGWSSITFNKELNAGDDYNEFDIYDGYNVSQTYAICTDEYYASLSLSDEDIENINNLDTYNVLDLLYMIQGSYAMDNYNLTELITFYFDDEFEIIHQTLTYPVFYHLKNKKQDLHFVVIRGTEDYFEYLQDLSLFFEAGMFQFLSFILPYLNALPTGFIRRIVLYSSLPEGLINSGARWQFYEEIYLYCREHIILNDEYNDLSTIYLVGHSLGGAISSIVAAKLYDDYKHDRDHNMDILSFGVANPGLLYSSAKFDFSMNSYDFTSTSVLPRGEFVGRIDEHGGLIQNIACKHDQFYTCHQLHAPICEIYNNCPKFVVRKSNVFDCYCNVKKSSYQFGKCLNVTCIDPDGKC